MASDVPIETRAASGLALAGGSLTLVVLTGSRKGASIQLSDAARIGKADDNDLVLGDDTVSRHHCELVREGTAVRVRDLGSTNGTFRRLEAGSERELLKGDCIRVGSEVLQIVEEPAPIALDTVIARKI